VFEHECTFGTERMIKEGGCVSTILCHNTTTTWLKVINSSSKEIVEWECKEIRGSEREREQLLSATKEMRTSP